MKKIILLTTFLAALSMGSDEASSATIVQDLVMWPGSVMTVGKQVQIDAQKNVILNGGRIDIHPGASVRFNGKFIALGDWHVTVTEDYGPGMVGKLQEVLNYVGQGNPAEAFMEFGKQTDIPEELASDLAAFPGLIVNGSSDLNIETARFVDNIILDGGSIYIHPGVSVRFNGKFIALGDWHVTVTEDYGPSMVGRLQEVLSYAGQGDPGAAYMEYRALEDIPQEVLNLLDPSTVVDLHQQGKGKDSHDC